MPERLRTLLTLHFADCEWWGWVVKERGLIAAHEDAADRERKTLTGTPKYPGTPRPRGRG